VPALGLWDSGPSSLIVCPTPRRLSAEIMPGANNIETANATANGSATIITLGAK